MDDYKALQIKAQTARVLATVTCQSDAIYESQVLDDCAAWIEEIQRAANVALPTIKRLAQELKNAQ